MDPQAGKISLIANDLDQLAAGGNIRREARGALAGRMRADLFGRTHGGIDLILSCPDYDPNKTASHCARDLDDLLGRSWNALPGPLCAPAFTISFAAGSRQFCWVDPLPPEGRVLVFSPDRQVRVIPGDDGRPAELHGYAEGRHAETRRIDHPIHGSYRIVDHTLEIHGAALGAGMGPRPRRRAHDDWI